MVEIYTNFFFFFLKAGIYFPNAIQEKTPGKNTDGAVASDRIKAEDPEASLVFY